MNMRKYIWKNFKHTRKRNNLNILGVIAGIILIIITNLVGFQLNYIIMQNFEPFAAHYQVVERGTNFFSLGPYGSEIPESRIEDLAANEYFQEITWYSVLFRRIDQLGENGDYYTAFGITTAQTEHFFRNWELEAGRFPENSNEIIMAGKGATFLVDNELQTNITILGRELTVVGFLEPAIGDLETYIIIDLNHVQEMFQREGIVSAIYAEKSAVDSMVEHHFDGQMRGFEEYFAETYASLEWMSEEKVNLISGEMISFTNTLASIFIFITVFCGAIFTVTTITLNVLSRKKELANLRAIGMSNGKIFQLIIGEITIIIGIALLIGLPIGFLTYAALHFYGITMRFQQFWPFVIHLLRYIPLRVFLDTILLYLGFSAAGTIIPYRIATRENIKV